ncbi:response regulator [Rhodocytophaga aerolata]|uniref:Response regulator n=1 Tax=Rhodocytophaga aerolata TaxID=455078 RepID=A0ABT8RJZ6_9BACT|nr:response regulator [Rhodocytophaga aerolata]MDO1451330.1 response regulator [Rhodocytophaga aerolata]
MQKLNCVLLIDDDRVTNYLHQLIISDLQIANHIHCCTSAEEALLFLEQSGKEGFFPELILLDRRMLTMDGFEFLEAYIEKEFHKNYAAIITMLTIYMNSSDLAYLQHIGFVNYIAKPLTEANLLTLVKAYQNRQDQLPTTI